MKVIEKIDVYYFGVMALEILLRIGVGISSVGG
jgi:hypothetical protein